MAVYGEKMCYKGSELAEVNMKFKEEVRCWLARERKTLRQLCLECGLCYGSFWACFGNDEKIVTTQMAFAILKVTGINYFDYVVKE